MRKAFSLIELMVVIIILGMLTALVVPQVMGRKEQAEQKLTCVQMRNTAQSLEMFRMDNGAYPTTEQGLEALISNPDADRFRNYPNGGYMNAKQAPKDPWNSAYIYIQDDEGFEILSLGADGKEGGDGQNKDIKLSECER
ncbi:type II secretion system protein GspG [Campylobacterota bacterium]|nr:type II secretion system protein GspG [Campylobacterota bacterium]